MLRNLSNLLISLLEAQKASQEISEKHPTRFLWGASAGVEMGNSTFS